MLEQPAQGRVEPLQLRLGERAEPRLLDLMLTAVALDDSLAPSFGEFDRHDSSVAGLPHARREAVALEGVEHGGDAGPRHSGEPGDSSRLERARHGDDEHDAEARPAPPKGPVDVRLEVVDEPVRNADEVEAGAQDVEVCLRRELRDPLLYEGLEPGGRERILHNVSKAISSDLIRSTSSHQPASRRTRAASPVPIVHDPRSRGRSRCSLFLDSRCSP